MIATNFQYLDTNSHYFDSASKTPMPFPSIQSEQDYHIFHPANVGRGDYSWSQKVTQMNTKTRLAILDFVGKNPQDYTVVFGYNATQLINMMLMNLNPNQFSQVIISQKDHNSVFLPALSWAKKYDKHLLALTSQDDNTLIYESSEIHENSILLSHIVSHIDGSSPSNLAELYSQVRRKGGLVLADGTQAMAHTRMEWPILDFDILMFSSHLIYGPHLGCAVVRKSIVDSFDQYWVGAGSVARFEGGEYQFVSDEDELYARFELGSQNNAAIHALESSISWLRKFDLKKEYEGILEDINPSPLIALKERMLGFGPSKLAYEYISTLSEVLFDELVSLQSSGVITLLQKQHSHIISFVPTYTSCYEVSDSLNRINIMVRAGFLSSHFYIQDVLGHKGVVRISLGYHNTIDDIEFLIQGLNSVLKR